MLYNFHNTLPKQKTIQHSLTKIFGINVFKAKKACLMFGINPTMRAEFIGKSQTNRLIDYLDKTFNIDLALRNSLKSHKQSLVNIKSYRGLRNWNGLPSRGQRTHTNKKTKKKLKTN